MGVEMRGTVAVSILLMVLLSCPLAASAEEIPPDVLARIKAQIAQEWPGNYSVQKTLVDANVAGWQKLQRNYTDIPDQVFFEIRDRVAAEWPDQYSVQATLVEANVKAWKELNQR